MTKSIFTIRTATVSTDPSLLKLERDLLLTGVVNNGVRFIVDTAFPFSYRNIPLAPVNGVPINDVAELANGIMVVREGQTVTYAGGGFDFTAITEPNTYIQGPESIAADLYTPYNGKVQRYILCAYVKLPDQADWNTGFLTSFLSFATSGPTADIASIAQMAGGTLVGVRTVNGAYVYTSTPALHAEDYGKFAQIAFYRTDAGVGITLRTSRARTTTTGPVGDDNTYNFSAQNLKIGVGGCNWVTGLVNQLGATNFRLYRAFVENISRSGRDPLTVLEADWLRVVARGDFT